MCKSIPSLMCRLPKLFTQEDTNMTLLPAFSFSPLSMSLFFSQNKRVHNVDAISDSTSNCKGEMAIIDDTRRASGSAKTSSVGDPVGCSGYSISSSIDQATIQSGGIRRQPQNKTSGMARHRRVCFIDEVLGLPPHHLVTSTTFRPTTTIEEKSILYYNSMDYAFFALEDYYFEVEVMQKCQSKGLSWEDCLVYDGDFGHDNEFLNEEKTHEGGMIRKVKTLHDLQL